jgi:hypothetical protein
MGGCTSKLTHVHRLGTEGVLWLNTSGRLLGCPTWTAGEPVRVLVYLPRAHKLCAYCHLQVKCTHVTEADYTRAAAGEWIRPGQAPPMPAVMQPYSGFPGMASIPGLPAPGLGLVPGLPGQAPLSIPSLTSTGLQAGGGLGLLGPGFGTAFPPPP